MITQERAPTRWPVGAPSWSCRWRAVPKPGLREEPPTSCSGQHGRYEDQCEPAPEDVAFIEEYAAGTEAESRSAVVRAAIEPLRQAQLEQACTEAFAEWDRGGEAGP